MSAPAPRRALLRGLIASTVASAAALSADRADAAGGPDAELIRICAQHADRLQAFNGDAVDAGDDNPTWVAYAASFDAIDAAKPQTLAGLVAKARAAKVEALCPDGQEHPENSVAAVWAWDLVNDMLRIDGAA